MGISWSILNEIPLELMRNVGPYTVNEPQNLPYYFPEFTVLGILLHKLFEYCGIGFECSPPQHYTSCLTPLLLSPLPFQRSTDSNGPDCVFD